MPIICNEPNEEVLPKFSLGELFVTSEALQYIPRNEMLQALALHASGKWAESAKYDIEEALSKHVDIQSSHESDTGFRFSIQTKADRSATVIFVPDGCSI